MRGTVWVVGFVFTRCVTLCPPVSNAMARLQEHLDRSRVLPEVKLLTVTVDPQYDTPEVLTAYAEKIGADLDSWELATGDVASITSFVVDGFKLAVGSVGRRHRASSTSPTRASSPSWIATGVCEACTARTTRGSRSSITGRSRYSGSRDARGTVNARPCWLRVPHRSPLRSVWPRG